MLKWSYERQQSEDKKGNLVEKLECANAAYLRLPLVTFGLPLVTNGHALQLIVVLWHTKILNWTCCNPNFRILT